jgi:phage-related protein (TIGR01555 family)
MTDLSRLPRQDSIAEYVNEQHSISGLSECLPQYIGEDRLVPVELALLFRHDDLSSRIVEGVVDEAVRAGWTVTDASENELDYPDEESLKSEIRDVLVDARLFGGAALLIGVNDNKDSWAEPLDARAADGVRNLVSLDRHEITFEPEDWHSDPLDPHFGEAEYYRVQPSTAHGGNVISRKVHRSRIVRIDGRDLPDRVRRWNNSWGDSVLQPVWNVVKRFHKVEDSISEIVDDFQTDVLEMEGLNELASDSETYDWLEERVELMKKTSKMMNTVLLDAGRGESYTKKASSVSGLGKVWDRFASSVARAAEYPMTKLFGLRPSGFNTDGESSKENWRKKVNKFRQKKLRRLLARVYEVEHPSKDIQIDFGEIKELTEQQEADIRLKTAKTDKIYAQIGSRTPDQVARSRDRPEGWSPKTKPRKDLFDIPQTEKDEILAEVENRLDKEGAPRLDVYTGPGDSNLPSEVEDLDKAQREQWVAVFNEKLNESGSEEEAFRAAWGALDV